MKKIFIFVLLAALVSCSKDKDEPSKDRTLHATVKEYQPPSSSSYRWEVRLTFNPQVTVQGSVKVEFDNYYLGAFNSHFSERINFALTEENVFVYKTMMTAAPSGQGWEVRNLKLDSVIQTSGNYNITLK